GAEEAGWSGQGMGWGGAWRARRGGLFACDLWSAAGVTTLGGGLGAGFLGFGFGALASPESAAVADPPSLAPSLAPSFAAGDLGFGLAAREAAAPAGDASPLSFAVGLIAAAFFFSGFFSGFDSVDTCAPGAGGLVPVKTRTGSPFSCSGAAPLAFPGCRLARKTA